MKFGITYNTAYYGADPGNMAALARHAEACGFESFYVPEHIALYPGATGGGIEFPPSLAVADPLECLSYVAATTERILLGTAVLPWNATTLPVHVGGSSPSSARPPLKQAVTPRHWNTHAGDQPACPKPTSKPTPATGQRGSSWRPAPLTRQSSARSSRHSRTGSNCHAPSNPPARATAGGRDLSCLGERGVEACPQVAGSFDRVASLLSGHCRGVDDAVEVLTAAHCQHNEPEGRPPIAALPEAARAQLRGDRQIPNPELGAGAPCSARSPCHLLVRWLGVASSLVICPGERRSRPP